MPHSIIPTEIELFAVKNTLEFLQNAQTMRGGNKGSGIRKMNEGVFSQSISRAKRKVYLRHNDAPNAILALTFDSHDEYENALATEDLVEKFFRPLISHKIVSK